MATDFSSLDKLIEFGLGLGIATQMMNTMNTVIARTAYPGVSINPGIVNPGSPQLNARECGVVDREFYIVKEDKVAGPLSERELYHLAKTGVVEADTFCWTPGMQSWNLAANIPEVNKILLLSKSTEK